MTVLILGAGVMQLPAIQSALEMGWRVAAADANADAPGAWLCKPFIHVDLKDREGLEAAALQLREEQGLDGVFTAGTDFSASVAWITERLGLPGIPFETALAASDKAKMRATFSAAGLPSPRFVVLSSSDGEAAASALALGLPLVVKPVDSMGARGCRAVRDASELLPALTAAFAHSRTGRAIAEEYIEGPEFSVDAIVRGGEIRIRGLADRHIAFDPYFVELGHTMPSAASSLVQVEVLSVFAKAVRALGINHGAAKGDIKYSEQRGGAVIGEIAARLSGGFMSGWTYPYASGIEVTREALELACGLEPAQATADRGWISAERAFISIPGKLSRIIGFREASALPYIKNIFLRHSVGDTLCFPSNNVEKCGNVISQAPDREAAVSAAGEAVRRLVLRLEAPFHATDGFLAGEGLISNPDGSHWPPDAFYLPPEVESELAEMPDLVGRGLGIGGPIVFPLRTASSVTGLDWTGRNFVESAKLAMKLAGAKPAPRMDLGVGRRFWAAVARGGVQAGLYVLDCLSAQCRGA